ncbi:hypothetical protein [Actinomadura rugatobispora]|uniref:MarR family transcriptional regulator n=1 Tax=Actinomadura rugatobispora TaxID=1994 RepID=A0ABW0ZYK7_9ACTN|nr:hypothetical protein GCM10010200_007070 [Actinomadura rugatobispora]
MDDGPLHAREPRARVAFLEAAPLVEHEVGPLTPAELDTLGDALGRVADRLRAR